MVVGPPLFDNGAAPLDVSLGDSVRDPNAATTASPTTRLGEEEVIGWW